MPPDPSIRPKTSFPQKLLLIFLGIFICLFLLELGLRLGGFVYCAMNPLPKDQGAQYRVLCIGESTTVGVGASDRSRFNYPHQLEGMLNGKFPRLGAQCFFDRNIGFNTTENLIKLPSYIEKYRPQLVIFMVGVNNWWNLDKSNILIFDKSSGFSRSALRAAIFMDQFRVYKLFKMIAYNLRCIRLNVPMPKSLSEREVFKQGLRARGYQQGAYKDLFSEIAFYDLREMVRICKGRGSRVIISGYPSLGQNKPLYLAQKKVAAIFGCPFVDNRTAFKRLPDLDRFFSSDQVHPNDKGYRLLAENIFNCILDNHFIDGKESFTH